MPITTRERPGASTSPREPPTPSPPTLGALFRANVRIAVHSFGGAGPWALRVLVEERGWLTREEFTEALGLCQILPGPNVVNLSIWLGDRFRGPLGALVAAVGLLGVPTVIACAADALLVRLAHNATVAHGLAGMAAAAAGLVIAMALKLGRPLGRRADRLGLALVAFAGLAILHAPLLAIVAVLGPIGVVRAARAARSAS